MTRLCTAEVAVAVFICSINLFLIVRITDKYFFLSNRPDLEPLRFAKDLHIGTRLKRSDPAAVATGNTGTSDGSTATNQASAAVQTQQQPAPAAASVAPTPAALLVPSTAHDVRPTDTHALPNTTHPPNATHGESGHGDEHNDHGGHHGPHAPEILYIFLTLILGALIRYGLKAIRNHFVLPYTVAVLVLGCVYAALQIAEKKVGEKNHKEYKSFAAFLSIANVKQPDKVLEETATEPYVFILTLLPGIIYNSAFHMKTHLFKKLFIHMVIIGTVGLVLNLVLVGVMCKQVLHSNETDWNLNVSFWFSAVISATDPTAVISILTDAGTAKTLMVVLEGTSLLSDTSAVVLSNLMMDIITTKSRMDVEAGHFFAALFGGPAWGLLIGIATTHLLSRVNSVWEAELTLILAVPYVTFWAAEVGFSQRLSGALATMTLGLWMSAHRTSISTDVEVLANRLWSLLSMISNTLIFSILGVVLVRTVEHHAIKGSDYFNLFVINILILLIRGSVFVILKPVLCRLGIGEKVFTWPHTFVLIWSGFRGAVSLTLAMQAAETDFMQARPRLAQLFIFHAAGTVAFTLLFNAMTMRFFLKRLGILEIPLAKMITMHMALKQILATRHQKLEALKADRYLGDADWQRVEDLTKVEGDKYGITDDGDSTLWMMHFVTREVACPKCAAEVQLQPLKAELDEMESLGRLRLINAKKTSFWRQFEEGTLSQSGLKQLDDLTDTALNNERSIIGADDIKGVIHADEWSGLKDRIANINVWVDKRHSDIAPLPVQEWRSCFHSIAYSKWFTLGIYVVIVLNVAETLANWVLTSAPDSDKGTVHVAFLTTNALFATIYTIEMAIRIIGVGWDSFWGHSWIRWNRLDILLLLFSYVDLAMDIMMLAGTADATAKARFIPAGSLRVFRFFRLVRFGRAMRLIRPFIPKILQFIDGRINAHLFLSYDVAKAFIIAQEECILMVNNVIGYKPLAVKFKMQAESDCRAIIKEIGTLNEKRPDVAAAVKTRQAIRSILNHLKKAVEHMKAQGVLDEEEDEHLHETIEERLKKLQHFPHSIALTMPIERLDNVSWIHGHGSVFEIMKLLFEEKKFAAGEQILTAGQEASGIYVVASGVISLTYHRTFSDHPEMGEIYNSDNLKVGIEEAHEGWERRDYALAGSLLNEQSLALDFPRRSNATADTSVCALYIEGETFFRALATMPAMELKFWMKVASSVALNMMIKQGHVKDTTLETEKARLSRGAVRLIRPGTRVLGINEFEDVYLIGGTVSDRTPGVQALYIGPRKIPHAVKEVEVRSGRRSVTGRNGELIQAEYAVFLLIPPNGRNISGFNPHDSQTNLLEVPQIKAQQVNSMLHSVLTTRNGTPPSEVQLAKVLQHLVHGGQRHRRRSTLEVDTSVPEKGGRRGSNAATLIHYAKDKQAENSRVVFNTLAEEDEDSEQAKNGAQLKRRMTQASHINI